MRGAELYDRVINWSGPPELTIMFALGVILIMLAALFLSMGRLVITARVAGVLGLLTIMAALFVIHEQTTREKVGEYITITRFVWPESTRFQIRVALLGLPAASVLVMIWVLSSTRRRLRSTVPDYLKDARKLQVQGDHDAALTSLNRALEISPYLGEAYYLRGCVHEARGNSDEALSDYDHALNCDPQHAHARLRRGRVRTEKGELDAALADFDLVMIMRPNDAECYLNRGICLARKGVIGDAIHDFQRVLKLTNHSDFAEPARYYLDQLGGENPLPPTMPGTSNPAATAAPVSSQQSAQDYVL